MNNFQCRSASTGARGSGVSAYDDTAMGPAHTFSEAIPSIALRFLVGRQNAANLAQCTGSDRPAWQVLVAWKCGLSTKRQAAAAAGCIT